MCQQIKKIILISGWIFLLAACFGEAQETPQEAPVVENPNDQVADLATVEIDEKPELTGIPDQISEPEPVTFCGAANPEAATILTTEASLSYLALVNRCYRVASDFSPEDLVAVNVASVNLPPNGVHELRATAAQALEELFAKADQLELNLLLSSAYRGYELQEFFFSNNVANRGLEEAMRVSAVPGHSEHQLGLAVDLTTPALEAVGWLDASFAMTPAGIWLSENAHLFGFIISFPDGREADVAIIYEPWHLRYVGVETATTIFHAGYVLEEFLWYNSN